MNPNDEGLIVAIPGAFEKYTRHVATLIADYLPATTALIFVTDDSFKKPIVMFCPKRITGEQLEQIYDYLNINFAFWTT